MPKHLLASFPKDRLKLPNALSITKTFARHRLGQALVAGLLVTGMSGAGVAHASLTSQTSQTRASVPVTPADSESQSGSAAQVVLPQSPLEVVAKTLPRVTADDVIKLASQQVGIKENGLGGGTKFHSWYMSTPRAQETVMRDGGRVTDYANAPWCNMFVSWVGEQLGIRPVLGWDAYTVRHAQWFKDNNRWGSTPTPGAVVFFAWGGGGIADIDHVGFVVKDNGDGTISTIEGNTGNGAVERRVRPVSDVAGYGYPVYAS
jgi:cell wall-associated NlpC family hydrolase